MDDKYCYSRCYYNVIINLVLYDYTIAVEVYDIICNTVLLISDTQEFMDILLC